MNEIEKTSISCFSFQTFVIKNLLKDMHLKNERIQNMSFNLYHVFKTVCPQRTLIHFENSLYNLSNFTFAMYGNDILHRW